MEKFIAALTAWFFSLPTRITMLALAFSSSFLLAARDTFLQDIHVRSWVQSHGMWVGLLCVASWSIVAATGLIQVEQLVLTWFKRIREKRRLHHLLVDEKKILRNFLSSGGHADVNNPKNLAWQMLVDDGILNQTREAWPNDDWQFAPKPWVLEYLQKNPGLVEDDATKG
jgi:hypothetical protein